MRDASGGQLQVRVVAEKARSRMSLANQNEALEKDNYLMLTWHNFSIPYLEKLLLYENHPRNNNFRGMLETAKDN